MSSVLRLGVFLLSLSLLVIEADWPSGVTVAIAPTAVAEQQGAVCSAPVQSMPTRGSPPGLALTQLPPLPEVSLVIGPGGGSIATPDGSLVLAVPQGALAEDAVITLAGQAPDPRRLVYTLFEFRVSGVRQADGSALAAFSAPLVYTLQFPADLGDQPGSKLADFSLLWFNDEGNYWYAVDSTVDTTAQTLTASIDRPGLFELSADPLLMKAPNEEIVYPEEGGTLTDNTGEIQIAFSPGDASERLAVSVAPIDPCNQHPSERHIISEFKLNAVAIDRTDAPVTSFAQAVELKVTHTLEQLIVYAPGSLGLYRRDESTGAWLEEPAQVDYNSGTVVAQLGHFSDYSTQARTDVIVPAEARYFQVDMQSGASSVSVPLDLPRGPGGFGPGLSLTYSSSVADEMKSSQSMASWTGAGWNLSAPSIVRDPFTGRYYLRMDGVSDLIVREDTPVNGRFRWHTKRETYLDITSYRCGTDGSADVYHESAVRTKDGTKYQFGLDPTSPNACANPNSVQFFTRYWDDPPGWHRYHYRMDVSRVTDTKGNTIDFTYWQDVRQDQDGSPPEDYVRAAYPALIEWGANPSAGQTSHAYRVSFTLGSDWNLNPPYGDQGDVRRDAPVEIGAINGCAQPHVMDTRYLDKVTVEKIDGTDIREYDVGYTNEPSSDPSETACAISGNLKLVSLAEKGASGGTLRTMSFSYSGNSIRYWDNSSTDCNSSIAGAPARPYLTTATNGFGGSVEFAYQRVWAATNPPCGWDRWVTAQRTLRPGAGQPDQVYKYPLASYQGMTYWWGGGMEAVAAEFRGFSGVTEESRKSDNTLLAKLVCTYETSGWKTGLATQCTWQDPGGVQQTKVVNSYSSTPTCTTACDAWEPGGEPELEESRFVALARTEGSGVSGSPIHRTGYTYDGTYGNRSLVCEYSTTSTTDGCPTSGLYRKTEFLYTNPNTSDYIVALPKQVTLKSGSGTVIADRKLYYDSSTTFGATPTKGLLTRTDIDSNGGWITNYQRYGFDGFGNPTSETDARGNSTTTTYACNNTLPSAVTAGGLTTTYGNDCVMGLPTAITDPNGVAYNIRYDQWGRRIKEWWPDDSEAQPTVWYGYDWDSALPNSTTANRKESGAATLWQTSCFDGFGRLIQTRGEAATGAALVDIAYDPAANKASESITYAGSGSACTGPSTTVKATRYEYDAAGRVTKVTNPDDSYRTIGYNAGYERHIDELNYCVDRTVDAFGRVTQAKEYETANCAGTIRTTTYGYDIRDNLAQITDASSNVTTIGYDKAGWKTSLADPDSGTWTYTYYSDGLLKEQTDARNIKVTMTYDALGRMTAKTFSNAGAEVAPQVTYTYDSCELSPCTYRRGHLTKVQEWAETATFRYDVRGRLAQERHAVAGADYDVSHAYDSMDRETTTTYPGGEAVARTFDSQGMIETLTGTSVYLESSSFNAASLPEELILGNNLSLRYDYRDTIDWRLSRLYMPTNEIDYAYTYDARGDIRTIVDAVAGETGTHTYDWAGRLTAVTGLGGTISYSYDAIGNMTSKREGSTTQYSAMAYGAGAPGPHALTSATASDGSHTYDYDATGNLLREWVGAQVLHEFNYDASGHVYFRRSEPFETNGYDYYYRNSDGTLVRKASIGGGAGTVYVGDIYEKDLRTGEVTKHYYAGGKRIAMRKGTTLYFLTPDHLGGTALVTTSAGTWINRVRYYPFGGIRTEEYRTGYSAPLKTDRLFTGQQRQGGSTVYDYGARMYNADIGRFVQADPVLPDSYDPQGLNRYSYVLNNPLRYTDPTGHCIPEVNCPPGLDWQAKKNEGWIRIIVPSVWPSGQEGGFTVPEWALAPAIFTSVDVIPGDEWVGPAITGSLIASAWVLYQASGEDADSGGGGTIAEGSGSSPEVTFGHGARHLEGTGLSQGEVEAAIGGQLEGIADELGVGDGVWGRVAVGGKTIEYRAHRVSEGRINVGTYYAEPKE